MEYLTYNQRSTTYNEKGFTVIEMIVYVAVLALILVGVINMVLAVSSTFAEMRANRRLNQSAALVLDRFVREVRDTDTVDTGASVFDADPGELVLDVDGQEVRFYVDSGTVKIDRDSVYEGDLTGEGVTASSFVLRHMTTGEVSEAVRLEILLDSVSGKGSAEETFYATAVVRGAYSQ